MKGDVVLEAENLARHYKVERGTFQKPAILKALDGASFKLVKGKTLAVVGESGCGKSTLARLVTMIEKPTSGELKITGTNVITADKKVLSNLHKKVQIVFQDPYGSLNPRQKIGHALEEPLLVNTSMNSKERQEAARKMISLVGQPKHAEKALRAGADILVAQGYDRMVHVIETGKDIWEEDPDELLTWLNGWRPDSFDLPKAKQLFDR